MQTKQCHCTHHEQKLPAGVFSAGVPAAFQANYVSSIRFLEGLEALCPTQEVC